MTTTSGTKATPAERDGTGSAGAGGAVPERGRRVGKQAILESGVELLRHATLTQLLSYASARGVAREADVTVGAVTHHFGSTDAAGSSSKEPLATALAAHALDQSRPITAGIVVQLLDEIERLRRNDRYALRRMADLAAQDLVLHTDEAHDECAEVAFYACCAAAPHDEAVRTMLHDRYVDTDALVTEFCDLTCDALGHTYVDGMDGAMLARAIIGLSDGLLVRSRFTPDVEALAELFADVTIRLMLASTTSATPAHQHVRSLPELLDLPDGSPLDPRKHQAIARAATALYDDAGWDAVTIAAVARTARVGRATVATHFGSRSGLSAVIWSPFVAYLQDEIVADRRSAFRKVVWRHLRRVAELSQTHRALTVALLRANLDHDLERGPPQPHDTTDPRSIAPVARPLEALLLAQPNAVRRNIADSPARASMYAAVLTNNAMQLAITHSEMTPSNVADYLYDAVLEGSLHRRSAL